MMVRFASTCLILLLGATQEPADRVRALVEKLGSDNISERERAEVDLGLLGRKALPELERALGSAAGEPKARLQRVIGRIKGLGTAPYVTVKFDQKPIREIASELERQSEIPIRCAGIPDSTLASLAVERVLVWKALDELCRGKGDVMYRIGVRAIELVPARYRPLPSADHESLRFVIDRFTWNRNVPPHDTSEFTVNCAVLTPPGARLLWMKVEFQELKDDKGVEIANIPPGHMEPMDDGGNFGLDSRRVGFGCKLRMRGRPSPEASTLARCSGKVEILFAMGERIVGSVKDPLSAPSSPAPEGPYGLSIQGWRAREGWLTLEVSAGYDAESVKDLPWRLGPLFLLRLKDGQWRSSHGHAARGHEREGVRRGPASYASFEWNPAWEVASLDFLVPDPVLKVEIPFDFRDLPLR